jgi:signal transduction histidine kinase
VRVSVHNGGEPIPADELPTLFEPVRRGSKVTNGQGLGLGLYITREIHRRRKGRLHGGVPPQLQLTAG